MATSKNNQQSTSPYKIEKGIEVVGTPRSSTAWKRYPLDKMKVGDSFLVPAGDPNARPHLVQPAVKNYNRNFNLKIKCVARIQEGGARRVWRVE